MMLLSTFELCDFLARNVHRNYTLYDILCIPILLRKFATASPVSRRDRRLVFASYSSFISLTFSLVLYLIDGIEVARHQMSLAERSEVNASSIVI